MLQRQLRPCSVYSQSQVPPSPAAIVVLFRRNLGKLLKYLMILYQVRHCQSFLRRVLLLNHRRQKMTWVTVIFPGSTPGIQGRSCLFLVLVYFFKLEYNCFIMLCWSLLQNTVNQPRVLCCAALRLVAQSCPTLCNSMGCSLPGSSVHGIL